MNAVRSLRSYVPVVALGRHHFRLQLPVLLVGIITTAAKWNGLRSLLARRRLSCVGSLMTKYLPTGFQVTNRRAWICQRWTHPTFGTSGQRHCTRHSGQTISLIRTTPIRLRSPSNEQTPQSNDGSRNPPGDHTISLCDSSSRGLNRSRAGTHWAEL